VSLVTGGSALATEQQFVSHQIRAQIQLTQADSCAPVARFRHHGAPLPGRLSGPGWRAPPASAALSPSHCRPAPFGAGRAESSSFLEISLDRLKRRPAGACQSFQPRTQQGEGLASLVQFGSKLGAFIK
jgi:hypothetical protein